MRTWRESNQTNLLPHLCIKQDLSHIYVFRETFEQIFSFKLIAVDEDRNSKSPEKNLFIDGLILSGINYASKL